MQHGLRHLATGLLLALLAACGGGGGGEERKALAHFVNFGSVPIEFQIAGQSVTVAPSQVSPAVRVPMGQQLQTAAQATINGATLQAQGTAFFPSADEMQVFAAFTSIFDTTVHSLGTIQLLPAGTARVGFSSFLLPSRYDVYLLAPGRSIVGATPLYANTDPNGVTYDPVNPGPYVLTVTLAGSPTTVLFQSKPFIVPSDQSTLLVGGSTPVTGAMRVVEANTAFTSFLPAEN